MEKGRRCWPWDGTKCRTTHFSQDDLKNRMNRRTDTWQNEWFRKINNHPVQTVPNHHSPKMDVLPKTCLQIILVAKWLVRHSFLSPNQQRRSLPSVWFLPFVIEVIEYCTNFLYLQLDPWAIKSQSNPFNTHRLPLPLGDKWSLSVEVSMRGPKVQGINSAQDFAHTPRAILPTPAAAATGLFSYSNNWT